ncbi:MAG: bifunctional nuclease family protein [Chlamydiae bacterium]|nr:bifunctional nuclease family protein [Chlamydiota bacterium]
MTSDLVPVNFHKILQSKFYTVFLLTCLDKRFAIYTDPKIGQNIQAFLAEKPKPRPNTYDLIKNLLQGLEVQLLQTVIYDVQDTVYFARLFVEQKRGDKRHLLEIDARPSDCLSLALMNNIPIFCKKEIIDKLIAIEA